MVYDSHTGYTIFNYINVTTSWCHFMKENFNQVSNAMQVKWRKSGVGNAVLSMN